MNKELKNEIKRLNRRLVQIGIDFGYDSPVYRNAIAPLINGQYGEILNYNKDGVPQLSTSNKASQNNSFSHVLNILRKRAKTLTERAKTTGETKQEIIERVSMSAEINEKIDNALEYLYNNFTDSEMMEQYSFLYEGRKMTQDEIETLLKDTGQWERVTGNLPFME